MCGIYGCVGTKNAVESTLAGLKKLEYRGYDSSGIAGLKGDHLHFCKEVGKISAMESRVKDLQLSLDIAIAQTRWATHGKPSQTNAHPHCDCDTSLAVVHNGIIENHTQLRAMLEEKGCAFASDTDTEVIAHLISHFYKGDLLKAIEKSIPLLKGAFAVALIHKNHPGQILAFANQSPLAVGLADEKAFIASDPNAFEKDVKEVIFLSEGEVALIGAGSAQVFDATMAPVQKETKMLLARAEEVTRGSFEHFTLKEIFEQPDSVRAALSGRCLEEYGSAIFPALTLDASTLQSIERILIIACGTSYHAGLIGAGMIEEHARIPAQVEIASEFRYKNPVVPKGTVAIAISQSGETADTLAAIRELKAKGVPIIALCNVQESSLARESDSTILIRAGVEVGVCSTKAFTSQAILMALFSLSVARMRHMGKEEGQEFLEAIKKIPDQIAEVLSHAGQIEELAKKYASYQNLFYLGRGYMYPTALEAALKVKEIAYVNANGYPGGELKHGPIALIDPTCPTIALCADIFEKMVSNLSEVKARDGKILAVTQEGMDLPAGLADDVLILPKTRSDLAPLLTSVAMQLFAYYVARVRGCEIDQPRNLAKSVTVE